MGSSEAEERLASGRKEEFLENGVEKASLRRICQKAGVTTGEVYFFLKIGGSVPSDRGRHLRTDGQHGKGTIGAEIKRSPLQLGQR